MAALQRFLVEFPTQGNRENILRNREFFHGIREFYCRGSKRPFLAHFSCRS
jgi:hypothetical protein